MQLNQNKKLRSSKNALENLLTAIKNTHNRYKQHLTNANNISINNQSNQMEIEITKCEKEYHNGTSDNLKVISDNNKIYSLNYNMNDIKRAIENNFVKLTTTRYNNKKNNQILAKLILIINTSKLALKMKCVTV